MTMRLIERIDSDGLRVESGFFDDAERVEVPKSLVVPRLGRLDYAIGFVASVIFGTVIGSGIGMIAVMIWRTVLQ